MPEGFGEGFFFGDNDFSFFQQVNEEFIEGVVEVPVGIYKVAPEETNTNIYGEADEGKKLYYPAVMLHALIEPDEQQTDEGDFTFDVNRPVTFGFQRERLKEKDIYPQRGDIIEFDNAYFEVREVVDNQMLSSKWFYRHSIVCRTHMARVSNLSLVDPRAIDVDSRQPHETDGTRQAPASDNTNIYGE